MNLPIGVTPLLNISRTMSGDLRYFQFSTFYFLPHPVPYFLHADLLRQVRLRNDLPAGGRLLVL
jgi:hypothetical protein